MFRQSSLLALAVAVFGQLALVSPAVAGGMIVAGAEDGRVYAFGAGRKKTSK